MNVKQGVFVVIDGVDGVGKTSVMDELRGVLSLDENIIFTREPWTPEIKKAFSEAGLHGINNDIELSNFDRRRHVDLFINPGLQKKKLVICDRYIWSYAAYQARSIHDVFDMYQSQVDVYPEPDLTILLTADIDSIMKRLADRGGESIPSRRRVEDLMARYGMLTLGGCGESFVIANTSKSASSVASTVTDTLLQLLFGIKAYRHRGVALSVGESLMKASAILSQEIIYSNK